MDDKLNGHNKEQAARRAFLRAVAYAAPVVVTVVKVNRAQAQPASCGPNSCPPDGAPCGPNGACGPGGGPCGPANCPPNN